MLEPKAIRITGTPAMPQAYDHPIIFTPQAGRLRRTAANGEIVKQKKNAAKMPMSEAKTE